MSKKSTRMHITMYEDQLAAVEQVRKRMPHPPGEPPSDSAVVRRALSLCGRLMGNAPPAVLAKLEAELVSA